MALVIVSHPLPKWVKPQLARLVDEAPNGRDWLHEVKYGGYRIHARMESGRVKLLTRTGLDWSHRYKTTVGAFAKLPVKSAYIDGELCALDTHGVSSFSRLQAAMDQGSTHELVFVAFDLLYLDGTSTAALPLLERKARLKKVLPRPPARPDVQRPRRGRRSALPQASLQDGSRRGHIEAHRSGLCPR